MSDSEGLLLCDAANNREEKLLNPDELKRRGGISSDEPLLVVLAAGKGTRFGLMPKCAQPVRGVPLARHSINAFRSFGQPTDTPRNAICVVGYKHTEVMAALGTDNLCVYSDNSTGGTAFAAFEAFSVPGLLEANPLLIVTMGDRVVTATMFQRLYETHVLGPREADLTLLTAIYEPPKNLGKGRIVRSRRPAGDGAHEQLVRPIGDGISKQSACDENREIIRIVEQRDIDLLPAGDLKNELHETTEGNCPLYVIRAATLHQHLSGLTNDNAQKGQYYFTDIVENIRNAGGDVRSVTTTSADPEYDLLCSDVTRPMDLALMENALSATISESTDAAQIIAENRHAGQVAAIASQLDELFQTASGEQLGFKDHLPVGIGIAGGRLRIAFMHPDMGRFFGPAWQMPIGAIDDEGREQIVILIQVSEDGKIHLYPTNPEFRERLNYVAAEDDHMYPGSEVEDMYGYEGFGTKMAESLLLSLGYFTDDELKARREKGQPLPPAALWISNSMRRPFSLIGNAIASIRTLRSGNLGAKVRTFLGRDGFHGLRVMSTGNIPRGGFSSSSAVTVAVKNALNALYELDIPADMLVHLACQAEYGTGVRAGALDQATIQKGKLSEGTLISSNPRENYRIIGTYPVPTERFQVLFPYSVDRDREAWRWSAGVYAEVSGPDRLTSAEMRKMTGKAAELAAILVQLPLDTDFFQMIESDLVESGELSEEKHRWVCDQLLQLPLSATQEELRDRVYENRPWYIEQLMSVDKLTAAAATERADATLETLFAGWRTPTLTRTNSQTERGTPLRAMVAYLFGEVAKNLYLIHHPDQWVECVSRSQCGDRCFEIDPARLPDREEMLKPLAWEVEGAAGPNLMEQWLQRFDAVPFDYNRGIDDESLASATTPIHLWDGTNFFRGLALIDLAEAMLKRAFGADAIAVRVNAAGQGDFFQVHVDTEKAEIEEVKRFITSAFYNRFGLSPQQPFVELHPGSGAIGARLKRFDQLPSLIHDLREAAKS